MKHEWLETQPHWLAALAILIFSLGGIVEIVPLFLIEQTVEPVPEMRPYTPLELLGRGIYEREGCYLCHSQMIRALQADWLRYGHYSLAAESQYDHPFQWGSRRIGPDLARVGGKYSNDWQVQHLIAPQRLVPASLMPHYPWLNTTPLDTNDIEARMRTLQRIGVPYSEQAILQAKASLAPTLTEMDALVAYLQMLGTLVDFKKYGQEYFVQFR